MRRILLSAVAIGALAAQPAMAQIARECNSRADQTAFEVEALKSQLMVLATSCHDDSGYNAFIRRYQPDLMANESAFTTYFKHEYGKRAQQEHDAYITSLANAQSDEGVKLGSDFCPRDAALFNEVQVLGDSAQLADYAAAKDLIPVTLGACAAPTPVSAHERVTRRVVHTTHVIKGKK